MHDKSSCALLVSGLGLLWLTSAHAFAPALSQFGPVHSVHRECACPFRVASVGCRISADRSFRSGLKASTQDAQPSQDMEPTLAEKAAQALQEAEEAEGRAEALRKSQSNLRSTSATSPPPAAVVNKKPEQEPVVEDPDKVAEEIASEIGRLQRSTGSPDPLSSTKWLLRLDFGREQGTWMDARWGASGSRVKATVAIELLEGGKVQVVDGYNYGLLQQLPEVRGGKWHVAGAFPSERLKFELEHSGLTTDQTQCDVDVPPGKLFLSVNTLGAGVSKQGGLSIEQFRFYVRRERRMVGVFRAERLE